MFHIALHFAVPLALSLAFYRPRWTGAFLVLIATMAVDVDHLLVTPIYDPERCSIGFHPLHTLPAIAVYVLLFALPLAGKLKAPKSALEGASRMVHLAGLGLLVHMALDWSDCF